MQRACEKTDEQMEKVCKTQNFSSRVKQFFSFPFLALMVYSPLVFFPETE